MDRTTKGTLVKDDIPEKSKSKDLTAYVPEMQRKPGELGFAVIWFIFGVLGYYFAMGMTHNSYSAPSVFPKLASVIIMLCSMTIFIKALKRRKPDTSVRIFQFLLPKDVTVMLSGLIVYCIVMPVIHFIPASYIFLSLGMIYLHNGKKIGQSLLISAGVLAVLVVIFRYIFLVLLP